MYTISYAALSKSPGEHYPLSYHMATYLRTKTHNNPNMNENSIPKLTPFRHGHRPVAKTAIDSSQPIETHQPRVPSHTVGRSLSSSMLPAWQMSRSVIGRPHTGSEAGRRSRIRTRVLSSIVSSIEAAWVQMICEVSVDCSADS